MAHVRAIADEHHAGGFFRPTLAVPFGEDARGLPRIFAVLSIIELVSSKGGNVVLLYKGVAFLRDWVSGETMAGERKLDCAHKPVEAI